MNPVERTPAALFEGAESLRVRAEWAVLMWSLVGIGIAAPVLSTIFPLMS